VLAQTLQAPLELFYSGLDPGLQAGCGGIPQDEG